MTCFLFSWNAFCIQKRFKSKLANKQTNKEKNILVAKNPDSGYGFVCFVF